MSYKNIMSEFQEQPENHNLEKHEDLEDHKLLKKKFFSRNKKSIIIHTSRLSFMTWEINTLVGILPGIYLVYIYSHANLQFSKTIQGFVVVSPVLRVTSFRQFDFFKIDANTITTILHRQ